jgi:hypothetical protein
VILDRLFNADGFRNGEIEFDERVVATCAGDMYRVGQLRLSGAGLSDEQDRRIRTGCYQRLGQPLLHDVTASVDPGTPVLARSDESRYLQRPVDLLEQFLAFDWLGEKRECPALGGLYGVRYGAVSGHQDDWQGRIAPLQALQQLNAILLRHAQV